MRRVTLTNLQTLCCIARLGSFTAAAERLNTTQPAISRRMRELESALDVELFRRQGRRMELTFQARSLVSRTEPLLSRLEEMVFSFEGHANATGTVRIGVGEIVTLTWFSKMMAMLKKSMPNVHYEVEVGLTVAMHQRLEAGQLDLAIAAASAETRTIASRRIGDARVQWMISEALEAKLNPRLSVRERLESHPVWCMARPAQMHQMVLDSLNRNNVSAVNLNISNNLQCVIEIVANGTGIALLPTYALRLEPKHGKLVPLSAHLPPETLGFSILSPRNQTHPLLQHIIDIGAQCCDFDEEVSQR